MSNRLNYIKKFIIFKDDYSNVKGLKAKGHGKLELKGNNLNISLNIKGAEANNFYDIDFIKRREAHTVGKIYTKENKSGERELDINYRELEKSGFSLDEVDGIILSRGSEVLFGESFKGTGKNLKSYIEEMEIKEVLPEQDEVPNEEAILEELIPEELVSKEINIEYVEEISIEDIAEEDIVEVDIVEQDIAKIDIVEEDIVEVDIVEEDIAKVDIVEQDIAKVDTAEEDIATQEEAKPEIDLEILKEEDDIFSEKMYEEIMEEIFNIPELGYEAYVDIDDSEINNKNKMEAEKMSEYVRNILNFFPSSEPFTMALEGYDWWNIEMEEVDRDKSFLPYFSYIIGGNNKSDRFAEGIDPEKLLDRYGHYIFGLYNEGEGVKFYMYGIPGNFSIEDYPKGGTTGFNTWFEGVEVPGYWILYIEPGTGKILYPINPMIPKA